ncbi:MAG: NAD(P)-binding domain-containing protein, partial [Gammaproteobacteria bacterium]|nr:NAD(P)-binding domain-containing protein [Gammaproteobacteria bacterium]
MRRDGETLIAGDTAKTVAVVGAGSWGTALALQFARCGHSVRLGGVFELDLLEAMTAERENARYLPGVGFPPNLVAVAKLDECLDGARDILVAVPSHGLRDTLMQIKPLLKPDARIC